MKIVVLCVTPLGILAVDRRVLNQCKILQEEGWNLHLIVPHTEEQDVVFDGIKISTVTETYTDADLEFIYNFVGCTSENVMSLLDTDPLPRTISYAKQYITAKKINYGNTMGYRYLISQKFLSKIKHHKPDAVYCADFHGMIAAKVHFEETQTPYIIDSHEYCLSHSIASDHESKLIRRIEEKCLKTASDFITVSHDFRELYKIEYGIDLSPLVYYNAPVIFPPNDQSIKTLKSKIGLKANDKIVLFHGGLAPFKRNLEALIESAKYLPSDIHIIFLGYGPISVNVSQSKYKNVHYLQPVDQEILQHHIKESNLIIIPYVALDINQLLCAPNRLFDALSTQTPLLINQRIASISRLVDQFNVGYSCEMQSPQQIAEGILHVIKSESVYRKAYQEKLSEIELLYGYESQAKVIRGVSDRLKDKLYSFICKVTFDMNLETIVEDLARGDHDSAINRVHKFVLEHPRLAESNKMLSLLEG